MTRCAILPFGVRPIVAFTDLLADDIDEFTGVVQLKIGRPVAEQNSYLDMIEYFQQTNAMIFLSEVVLFVCGVNCVQCYDLWRQQIVMAVSVGSFSTKLLVGSLCYKTFS